MAEAFPGAANVFTPAFQQGAAGAQLMVEFSRNPDRFAVNQYSTVRPVDKSSGWYFRADAQQPVRLVNVNDHVWNETDDRPRGKERPHEFVQYTTRRYTETFRLGYKTIANADFPIVAMHARGAAVTMMTVRSLLATTVLTTTANFGSTTATIDALFSTTDAAWNSMTTTLAANAYIQRSVQTAIRAIHQRTGGAVAPGDLVMVMDPTIAHGMSPTPELVQYAVNYPAALQFWMGEGVFQAYGLPPALWGVGVVVEDAVRDTAQAGATNALGYMMGNKVAVISRPGDLVGEDNSPEAPTLSSLSCFTFEDFTVEINSDDDQWNRRTLGGVTDDLVYAMTAPDASYLFQDVTT